MAELAAQFKGVEAGRDAEIQRRLSDLGELRLRKWTKPASTFRVLPHGAPSAAKGGGSGSGRTGPSGVNDRPHAATRRTPTRFARPSRRCPDRQSAGRRR